eukprot:IDg22707t1
MTTHLLCIRSVAVSQAAWDSYMGRFWVLCDRADMQRRWWPTTDKRNAFPKVPSSKQS